MSIQENPNNKKVNVEWINWSDPDSVKETLKEKTDLFIEKTASTVQEALKTASDVSGIPLAEGAKKFSNAQVKTFCPEAAIVINPVMNVSTDVLVQNIPQAIDPVVDATSKIVKISTGKSIDFLVDRSVPYSDATNKSLSK